MKRTALILLLALALALALVPSLAAQPATCTPPTNSFVRIPELAASGGTLKGTIVFSAENECLPTRVPATKQAPSSTYTWSPQFVRIARGVGALPAAPPPVNGMSYPLPGPTLRARVGDLVQLTLLNQIDPNDFPYSIDQGEKSPQGGCDQTSLYPGTGPYADKFPDCFHGSSTVNIHFHGTHTNPNSTGDNVFLEIRPSPRTQDAQDAPTVTQASVQQPFDEFFTRCAQELPASNPLRQWPFTWADLPASWTATQEALLKEYDKTAGRTLWPTDARQLAMGAWPQYYIGAYPYCYRIPEYTGTTWPPTNGSAHAAHTAGAGAAEQPASTSGRALQMGQSPGTHWYHAHKHGSTAINVANGLTGVFIIEGQYDDDLNAFYGKDWTKKQPVMVINQLGVGPNLERGGGGQNAAGLNLGPDKGPSLALNGRIAPQMTMAPGEVQLWRIVNTSGRAGVYFDGPPAGFQWMQLAQDGVQFSDANYKKTLNRPFLLASGNRADILVMAPPKASKTAFNFMVQNAVDQSDIFGPGAQPQNTLLSVLVTGTAATGNTTKFIPNAPAFPPFLADITAAEVKGTQELVFTSEFPGTNAPPPSIHSINNQEFSGEVGEVVLLNNVQEWKVSNATNASAGPPISHPFHIHINPFQVVEEFAPNSYLIDPTTNQPVINPATKQPYQLYVFDKNTKLVAGQCYVDPNDPSTWKPCSAVPPPANIWWDVFPIPTGTGATDANGNPVLIPGYFKMRSRFVDYSGYYVLHCHILAHEDRGMMTVVQVAPMQSPYSHH